jgi:hypothetical protein
MHPPENMGAFYLCSFSAEICPGYGGDGNGMQNCNIPGAFAVLH